MSYIELFYPATEQPGWVGRGPSSGSDASRYHYANSYNRSSYPSSAVVLHVSMCCEKCVQKVRKALKNVDDIESVDIDMQKQKVIVRGYANPERVLRKVQKVKKSATYWDSSHDYANYSTGAYAYHVPSSSAYDYDYYSPRSSSYDYNHYSSSPSYDYSYNYPSPSYDYSYNYPSTYEYSHHNNHGHRHSSYDAYRYR